MIEAENERILLFITHAPSTGTVRDWLKELPFAESLAQRGTWAPVMPQGSEYASNPWQPLVTGSLNGTGTRPFWQLLEEAGQRVLCCGTPPNSAALPIPISAGDPLRQVGQKDWKLMIVWDTPPSEEVADSEVTSPPGAPEGAWRRIRTRIASLFNPNSGGPATDSARSSLHHWLRWDKEIAPLGIAVDAQTAVMAIFLPSGGEREGALVAGGGCIAPLGESPAINLLDLPPTILWLLDVAPSKEMTGRVWDDLWQSEASWTEAEKDALVNRLKGLGYLS